ncbi:hypothetical protein LTR84_003577 [Exophiala bonariae]|uniref:FAD-binding domain-containing protein n=1 Tax=Exophiala bonariae TaxID=1690606 RepID=A0AAV9N7Q4_9EURO|nr:hypothetical protein LTR84_003577 [Exophiala bonariae]
MVFEVAIIGAGLGGPALALELLEVPNVKCTIYELRGEGYEQGQHISLAPNALRVLENIGILEKLQKMGNSYEDLHLRNASGAQIVTFHNGNKDGYGFSAMRIHRHHVQRVLIEACQAKGVSIRHGMKIQGISEDSSSDEVELTFANGETAYASFVVGADGLHSIVREHVVKESTSIYAHMIGVTGYLQKRQLHPSANSIGLPSHFIGHNGFIAIMPSDVSGNEIGFFSTMDFGEERSKQEWDELFKNKDAIRSILRERFCKENGWCELVDSLCKSVGSDTLCSWPFYIAPQLPTWSTQSGRVLVIGDAAHAMIPTGGLGASLAFEDAECLALTFRRLGRSNFDLDAAPKLLKVWEGHRKQRLALIQDFTNKNRRLRQPGGSRFSQYLKEWAIWLFFLFIGKGGQAEEIYRYDTATFQQLL